MLEPATRSSCRLNPSHHAPVDALGEVKSYSLHGSILTMEKGIAVCPGELVFAQDALIGRKTRVIHATTVYNCLEDWEGKSNAVKTSSTPKSRTSHGEILNEILGIVNGCRKLHAKDHNTTEERNGTQDHKTHEDAQLLLSVKPKPSRVLQNLAMTELFPATELKTSAEIVHVIRDVFRCYRRLYEHAEVVHGDISLDNIMYQKEEDNVYGVLSDYDLSLCLKEKLRSKQRTGTRVYMAIDLLRSFPMERNLYRHDLESLFYVIIIIACQFAGGKDIQNPPLQDWFTLATKQLRIAKELFLNARLPDTASQLYQLDPLLIKLKAMFMSGYWARVAHIDRERVRKRTRIAFCQPLPVFDEITLGGHVDFNAFEEILFEPFELTISPISSSSSDEHTKFSTETSR